MMRNINDTYLVESEIINRENISAYKVKNLKDDKKYILHIIENESMYEKIREYLINKFLTVKNLNFDNLVKLIKLEIIFSIDNIKLNKVKYAYLTEDLTESGGYILENDRFLKDSSIKERIDVFMQIASAINTLNIKGYLFEEISFNDIKLVKYEDGNIQVKINNIMEYEINKVALSDISNFKSLPYPYNIKEEENNNSKDNILYVVKIFNLFFTAKDLNSDLKKLKNINTIYNKLNNYSKSIKDFIRYINEKLSLDYPLFNYSACDRMQSKIDIVGMEEELNIVEKNLKSILENRKQYKVIGFNGAIGSGKTRLLDEINYIIRTKYFCNMLYLDGKSKFKDNIKEFCKNIDSRILNKYKEYLKEYFSCEDNQYNEYNYFILINRISNLFYDCSNISPIVILIDDLELKDKVVISFIRYLIFAHRKIGNLFLVFSVDSNENEISSEVTSLYDKLKEISEYEEYTINYFNQYNINEMIRNMLGFEKNASKIANSLYYNTLGNPLFTVGIIEELYENKTLFFDIKTGEWKIKKDIMDIAMPKKLTKKLERNVENLSEDELDTLGKLSVFNTPLSEDLIVDDILNTEEEVNNYFNLKKKGYFINKISDVGMFIGFSNTLLKNLLYMNLNNDKKKKLHEEACTLFEEILIKTDYYIDELLFHLESCKSREKLYFYTMVCGECADTLGNTLKSIYYYKKALTCCDEKKYSEIAIIIAKLYMKASNNKQAYKYFSIANEFAIKNNNENIQVYALIQMVIIKIKNNVFIDLSYPLMIIRDLLDKDSYILEEAYYYYAIALNYKADFDNNMAYKNAIKGLDICEKNKLTDDVYGLLKMLIGEIKFSSNEMEESKKIFLEAAQIFEEKNNLNEYLTCMLINIYYFNREDSLENLLSEYIEVNKYSNKFRIHTVEILSYIYISYAYISEKKYEEAEEYLLKAMERQAIEGVMDYSFKIFNTLCLVYVKTGKASLAIKYYYLAEQQKNKFRIMEEDIINFSYMATEYYCFIYNYEKAKLYSEDIYGLINSNERYFVHDLFTKYYEFKLFKCKNEEEIKEIYSKILEETESLTNEERKKEIKLNIIRKIFSLGYSDFAKEAFLDIKDYPEEYEVEAQYIYLEFFFRYDKYYNFLINKALRVAVYLKDIPMKADLYCQIARKYESLNCKLLTFTYYYEALEIYVKIINDLLDSDKICYVNNSEFLEVRKSFIKSIKNLGIDIEFEDLDQVKTIEQIDKITNELRVNNLVKNYKIHEIMEEFYEKCYFNDLNNIYQVFESFSNDIVLNLNNVIKYLARMTLANKALLVIEDDQGENNIISMYRISDKNEINYYLSLNSESLSDSLLISNEDSQSYEKSLRYGLKACLYLKIKNIDNKINIKSQKINAKLIFASDNSINYINEESRKIVEEFIPFLIFLLTNYKLNVNSSLDRLTGAYNRKYFEEEFINLIEKSNVTSEFAIIMFDIDDFKGVNDKYGHQKGDEVLIKLVAEVKKTLSKKETLCRYGGEEFIILIPDANAKKATSLANLIRNNVESAKLLGDKRKVTISLGVAVGANKVNSSEELIKKADEALYMAKFNGRNRVEIWKPNCGISNNLKNELSGVVSDNGIKDYNLVIIIKELSNLLKVKNDNSYRINEFILRLMELVECEMVGVFIIRSNNIENYYYKQRNGINDLDNIYEVFDRDLILSCIESQEGKYMVQWDKYFISTKTNMPEWRSVCIKPVVYNGEVVAVVYLTISVSEKEYNLNDYNVVTCLSDYAVCMFY